MRGSCGKLHFLFQRRFQFCESRRGARSRYCHNVLSHFAGRGRSMSHTVKIHPCDVNCGWPGALNPHMSQWEFLSHYWQKYARQIPTYHWLCYSIHFKRVFALYRCLCDVAEVLVLNHTARTIRNQLCQTFAGARPSCRKIREELNKGWTWQHSQAVQKTAAHQLKKRFLKRKLGLVKSLCERINLTKTVKISLGHIS